MSLNRFNPRRDGNEPGIRSRFKFHGWHTEQLSGKGMPDLLCWPFTLANKEGIATWGRRAVLVDVKEPTGKPTAAQVLKWQSLKDKGIPVYVARTEEDVDAIVAGIAESWAPGLSKAAIQNGLAMIAQTRAAMEARTRKKRSGLCTKCKHLRSAHGRRGCDRAHPRIGRCGCIGDSEAIRTPVASYAPPRTLPDVAKEAEATFAPCPCGDSMCGDCAGQR